jgi:hypothetical protein
MKNLKAGILSGFEKNDAGFGKKVRFFSLPKPASS